jgi:hypothetical protein
MPFIDSQEYAYVLQISFHGAAISTLIIQVLEKLEMTQSSFTEATHKILSKSYAHG